MTIRKVIGALALMGCMVGANAASISLVPTGATDGLMEGDIVTFDIVANFTGESTIGGGLDILWDESVLQFDSITGPLVGEPDFSRACSPGAGICDDLVASAFSPLPDQFTLAAVSFRVAGLGADTTTIMLAPGEQQGAQPSLSSFWVSAADFVSPIPVDYQGADVTGVPVPAAVWFMLSGLGALIGFGRKSA